MSTTPSPAASALPEQLLEVFGHPGDSMAAVEQRARQAFPDERLIVWEGDAQTFEFLHVGGDAEALLGYAPQSWTTQATFWVDEVVHPDDQRDAVAYCALATGKHADHLFEYRARHRDGRIVWLLDYVSVVMGARGVPVRLRGLMVDITPRKVAEGRDAAPPTLQVPTRPELLALDVPAA